VLQRFTGHGAAYFIDRFFGLHGDSEVAVNRLFTRTTPISTYSLVFALVTAVVFSTGVAAVQQRAFERIWAVPRIISFRSYVRQLTWAVMLGGYSVLLLSLGRLRRELGEDIGVPAMMGIAIVQGAVTFVFYWWSQRWLLAGRVAWRSLLPGAIAVGVLTTIMFRLTRVIMPAEMAWPVRAYGLIGAVFVMSVWLMILCVVIFGGALYGALLTERRTASAAPIAGPAAPIAGPAAPIAGPAPAELAGPIPDLASPPEVTAKDLTKT
jgi:membrane protein